MVQTQAEGQLGTKGTQEHRCTHRSSPWRKQPAALSIHRTRAAAANTAIFARLRVDTQMAVRVGAHMQREGAFCNWKESRV